MDTKEEGGTYRNDESNMERLIRRYNVLVRADASYLSMTEQSEQRIHRADVLLLAVTST
jgi:hypothetical protein